MNRFRCAERYGCDEHGQTAMMLALLMVIVMILLPMGVLIIAQSQPALSAQELSSQQASQAAQAGISAYQVYINAGSTGDVQKYCSGGYSGLANGWTCNTGTDSRSDNSYYNYSDSSVPGFVNCFDGTGNSGVYVQGNSGSTTCVSQPRCPSSSSTAPGWQTTSGSASTYNTGYQFVVNSSSVQNSAASSGTIYVFATGRAGESGNYVCATAKLAFTDNLPKPQSPETLTTNIATCGSSTALPTPTNATSANITLAGGNGSAGGPGSWPFTGTPGGGGDGTEMSFSVPIAGNTYTFNAGCGATGTGSAGAGTGFASGGAGGNDGGAGGGASAICMNLTAGSSCDASSVSSTSNLLAVAGGGGGGGEGDGWFGVGGTGGCAGGVPTSVPCQSPIPTLSSIAAMTSGGGGCGVDIFGTCIAGAGGAPVSNTSTYSGVGAPGQPGQSGGADGGGGGGGFIGGLNGQASNAFFGWGFGGGGGSGGTSWVNPSASVSGLTWSNNTFPAGSPGISVTFTCSSTCTFASGSPYSATGSTFSWPAPFSCGGSDPFTIQPPDGTSSFSLTLGVAGANGGYGSPGSGGSGGNGGSGGAAIGVLNGPVTYSANKPQPQVFSVDLGCAGTTSGSTTLGFSQGGQSGNPGAKSSGSGGGSSGICLGATCVNGTTASSDVLLVGAGGGGGGEDVTDGPQPQSNYTSGGNSIDDNNPNESSITMYGGNAGGQLGGDGVNCDGSFVSQPCVNDGGSPNNGTNNGGAGQPNSAGADGGGGGGGYNTTNSGGGVGAAGMGCVVLGFFTVNGCGGGPGGQGGYNFVNTTAGLPAGYSFSSPCTGPVPLTCDGITVTSGGSTISGTIQFTSNPNDASISTLASGFSGLNGGASTTTGPAW